MSAAEIQKYFETCRDYWIKKGDTLGIATRKALWWDCVEVWNTDKSWNEAKVDFVHKFKSTYKPYDEVPPKVYVEQGMV